MPFSPGELCCVSKACVLMDIVSGSGVDWELIPHVTNISFSQTASTQKLVTSSTGGRETSACGTVAQTGTLAIACHDGTGPQILNINGVYHLRWSEVCENIWDRNACAAVAEPTEFYLEAYVRITSVPINYNIAGNALIVYEYGFDIVAWVEGGDPQNWGTQPHGPMTEGFVHCN